MTIHASYFDGNVLWLHYSHEDHVQAFITANDDGTYTIFLPAVVSDYKRRKLALHELDHLKRGDFHTGEKVIEIENRLS